jgi:cytoskeletal protein RodZ
MDNDATPTKPAFGQKVKRHCHRFWWLHVIIFVVVVLVVTLPVYVFFSV